MNRSAPQVGKKLQSTSVTASHRSGFTIVELLIVIVVIGILAAISIVAYNGIQNRANDTAVRNDLANIAKKFELFKVDNDVYPSTAVNLNSLNVNVSKGAYQTNGIYNLVPCYTSTGEDYAVGAISNSGKSYFITSRSGVREYTGSGSWSQYATICNNALPGSTYIGGAVGYAVNAWRPWTGS